MKNLEKQLNKLDRQLERLERTVDGWGFLVELVLAGEAEGDVVLGVETTPFFFDADELFSKADGNEGLFDQLFGKNDGLSAGREGIPEVFQIWEEGNFLGEYADPDPALRAVKSLGLRGEDLVLAGVDGWGRSTRIAAGEQLVALADTWPWEMEAMLNLGRAILNAAREMRGTFDGA